MAVKTTETDNGTVTTYTADTPRGALDVLKAVTSRIESEIRGQFPGDTDQQQWAKDEPFDLTVTANWSQLAQLSQDKTS
ncbi:hypothetical protein [Streptomyces ipomoeae]|uniref:hypothetical protein n=1 Tax=Streptomyces ipomoeae TaxID=103232 RepID=UPI0011472DE1|nr:hypothetical protein [Streptomyces ipomoeae]TQE33197.1 hypothetical protein Sipo7851_22155 [Streptomyces ipomoeae]